MGRRVKNWHWWGKIRIQQANETYLPAAATVDVKRSGEKSKKR